MQTAYAAHIMGSFLINQFANYYLCGLKNKSITSCNSLKLEATDGKMRLTNIAYTKAKDYLKIEES